MVTIICGLRHSFRGHSEADCWDHVHGSGAVVVTKCNNPTCSTPLRYLEDGRLCRLEVQFVWQDLPRRRPDLSRCGSIIRHGSTDLGDANIPAVAHTSCKPCGETDPAERATADAEEGEDHREKAIELCKWEGIRSCRNNPNDCIGNWAVSGNNTLAEVIGVSERDP